MARRIHLDELLMGVGDSTLMRPREQGIRPGAITVDVCEVGPRPSAALRIPASKHRHRLDDHRRSGGVAAGGEMFVRDAARLRTSRRVTAFAAGRWAGTTNFA